MKNVEEAKLQTFEIHRIFIPKEMKFYKTSRSVNFFGVNRIND
ncbi:hypothetical protein HMPREF1981_00615 [Bacteroides pyogenes F0041]|uniref:Uncharacterized protein n=1 Tax=Bacteroides pyogenes F0041 TaxID=1321819 RepID=U2E711_9BACE|nr:hypothetical protein HMPREF1981_00615 [Bacteroides pyogenes F0041]